MPPPVDRIISSKYDDSEHDTIKRAAALTSLPMAHYQKRAALAAARADLNELQSEILSGKTIDEVWATKSTTEYPPDLQTGVPTPPQN